MSDQTSAQRHAKLREWESLPEVVTRHNKLRDFALREELRFDIEGMNRVLLFNLELDKIDGPLPDSGIQIG